MTTVRELAELGLEVMKAQRRYFDNGRKPFDLDTSKRLERQFTKACEAVLDEEPDLFENAAERQEARM